MRNYAILLAALTVGLFSIIFNVSAQSNTTSLILNEIMPNPSGSDTDYEWIELINASSQPVDITGWQIDTKPISSTAVIQPGQIVILAKKLSTFNTRYPVDGLVIEHTTISMGNSGGSVVLAQPDGTTASIFNYSKARDELSYELLSGSCGTISENQTGHTVAQVNTPCIAASSNTPAPTAPNNVAAEWGITLVNALPSPESGLEWVELTNVTSSSIDLSGWYIADTGGKQALTGSLAAGQTQRIEITTITLNNSGDTLRLLNPLQKVVDVFYYSSSAKGEVIGISAHQPTEAQQPAVLPTPQSPMPTNHNNLQIPKLYKYNEIADQLDSL